MKATVQRGPCFLFLLSFLFFLLPALFYGACVYGNLYRWEPHFWATASVCTDTMWGGIERSGLFLRTFWFGLCKIPGLLAVPDKRLTLHLVHEYHRSYFLELLAVPDNAWLSLFVKCKAKTATDTLSILPLFVSTRRTSSTCPYAFFVDFSSHLQMVAFRTCFLRRPVYSRLKDFGSVENAVRGDFGPLL
ncbi:hypothetical protein C8F04DRAFT_1144718 [Mycena alexandri]|uniref:Uncharacterized protein n=1 Tax=Mycena alexandri TaxID=1745969 RepID=A0AAD6S5I5_9AGAR|nr:hypothetical protein C8F04DRAFT_1144718 [Mycena alexandri]